MPRKVKGRGKKHRKGGDHKKAKPVPKSTIEDESPEVDANHLEHTADQDGDTETGTESEQGQSFSQNQSQNGKHQLDNSHNSQDDSEVRDSTATTFILDPSTNWTQNEEEEEGTTSQNQPDDESAPQNAVERYDSVEEMGLAYLPIFEDYSMKYTDVSGESATYNIIQEDGVYQVFGILGHTFTEDDIHFQISVVKLTSNEDTEAETPGCRIVFIKRLDELLEISPTLVEEYITLRMEMKGLQLPLQFKGGRLEIPQLA